MVDTVLTEALIKRCPIFALVFGNLLRENNIEQLYKDNYYFLDAITLQYDCEFDTSILEMVIRDMYACTLNDYLLSEFGMFTSVFSSSNVNITENFLCYIDSDIRNELHILEVEFGLSKIDLADSMVYQESGKYNKKVIANKFSFKRNEIEPFVERLDIDKLIKYAKKCKLERRLKK